MIRALFDPSYYAYAYAAWPPVIIGTTIAILAAAAFVREKGSEISRVFLALAASASIWLLSFGGIYSTYDPNIARLWALLETAAVAFIPSLLFRFTLVVLKQTQKHRLWANLSLAASTLFAALALVSPYFVTEIWRFPWGFYPLYGPASWPFLAFMAICVSSGLALLWTATRQLPMGQRRTMLRSFFIALSIGSLGCVDLFANFRIAVYPIGYLPVYTCLLMLAQSIWRYNFSEITLSLAAPQILETLPNAVLVTDPEGVISQANPKSAEIFERPEHELIGLSAPQVMPGILTPGEMDSLQAIGFLPDNEFVRPSATGPRYLSVSVSMARDSNGRLLGYVCVVRNMTARRLAEEALRKAYDEMELRVSERTAELSRMNLELGREIEHRKRAESALQSLSITDPLTGLYNRRGFVTLATQLLKQALRVESAFLVFMADLDGLKEINDKYGHLEGDHAIHRVATILKDVFRDSDVVSRLGGDEFAIAVVDDSPDSHLEILLQRLARSVEAWNAKADRLYALSFSIGVARRTASEDISIETLMQRADQQLYEQKRQAKRASLPSKSEINRPD